jgi:glutaconyl-CoA/methylmalonyl-CoA decarboxylase subunit gamma
VSVDFMLALNVTIYGLGIVFLALLVLMVAIMILTKIFAMVTGKDTLEVSGPTVGTAAPVPAQAPPAHPPTAAGAAGSAAPAAAQAVEAITAPLPGKILSVAVKAGNHVGKGDELCVIEAMKMGNSVKASRDGVVAEVCVASGDSVTFGAPLVLLASTVAAAAARSAAAAAASPVMSMAPTVEPSALTLTVAGASHAAEVTAGTAGAAAVLLDGSRYQVQRDPTDGKRIVVNGQSHTVEVKEKAETSATVVIDGISQKVEIARRAPAAPAPFSLTHGGRQHTVELTGSGDGATAVLLDGSRYQAEQDKTERTRILVNGQPHTVEVKEIAGTSATVLIDGRVEKLEVARQAAPVSVPTPAVAAAAAPAPPGRPAAGERVTAPLPGKILSVAVKAGDRVQRGDELCVIEAMKMGNSIRAQRAGTVRELCVAPGQTVAFAAPLVVLD